MDSSFIKLEDLRVEVENVIYTDQVSDGPERPYGFVYFIAIHNRTPHTVQLLARKWIVTEASGKTLVLEGEGIVGEKPSLEPGESFRYNSCHVNGSDAVAKGAFYGLIKESKKKIMTEIPSFSMEVPV